MATADTGRVGLILVAGGSGTRLGADRPKAFVRLRGQTLLWHCLVQIASAADEVVVVAPASHLEDATREVAAVPSMARARVVQGGATRAGSVAAGFRALRREDPRRRVDIVAVHDVARPMASAAVLRGCVDAVRAGADAVAPAQAITDTLKRVAADGRTVMGTEPREPLRAVQTPQVFPWSVLEAAHTSAHDPDVTDDLALVERAGGRVVLLDGSLRLMKITHPLDLTVASAIIDAPEEPR